MNWSRGERVPGALDCVRRPHWDFHLEWLEFYKQVTEHYGIPWRMSDWEVGQDSYMTVEIDAEGSEYESLETCTRIMAQWMSTQPPAILEGYEIDTWYREREPSADVILWHLCLIGKVPPGRYLITKWW